jgi:hypothetical protein
MTDWEDEVATDDELDELAEAERDLGDADEADVLDQHTTVEGDDDDDHRLEDDDEIV